VASPIMVGMAEIAVRKGPALYSCLGLGSCIGLAFFDGSAEVSGMIHIMLPGKFPNRPVDKVGKFADTGIEEILNMMEGLGANKSRLVCAYAGGAQVFKFGTGNADTKLEVGARNADAVEKILASLRIRTVAKDVGGTVGRTVNYNPSTGEISVRSVTTGEKLLCKLR